MLLMFYLISDGVLGIGVTCYFSVPGIYSVHHPGSTLLTWGCSSIVYLLPYRLAPKDYIWTLTDGILHTLNSPFEQGVWRRSDSMPRDTKLVAYLQLGSTVLSNARALKR